jgi:predicted short-subunit dehydrogenase-like oxidoreductase (DUF2520 family)
MRITTYMQADTAFIGAGRLATGLGLAMARSGHNVVAVASRSPGSASKLAAAIPGCLALGLQSAADMAELVIISAPDDAIAGIVASLKWRPGQAVVHCSGATEVSVLAPAEQAGARIGGFHPMQAFTDPQAALASLPGCTIAIEANDATLADGLDALAVSLGCRAMRLPPGCRARYHASGGYASQFVNVLMREATDIWKSFGVSEADAVRALLPLLRGTLAAIEKAGVAGGMPGPVSRGDVGTVKRHVEDLGRLDAELLAFYCELARRSIPLAVERGSLDEAKAQALREMLARRS